MGININIHHYHHTVDEKAILKQLNTIMTKIEQLQQDVTDLKAQSAELQASVDLEQAQIAELLATNAAVVTGLNETIAGLQAQLADSPTPDQLQAVIDGVVEVKDQLALTKEDIQATV